LVLARAQYTSTSTDLAPSIGVGLNPDGAETVLLN
jgi:hypothetical protein